MSNQCSGCISAQNFCKNIQSASHYLGDFNWHDANWPPDGRNQTLKKDDYFLSKIEWNGLINYIKNAYNLGNINQSNRFLENEEKELKADELTNPVITAAMFNSVCWKMQELGNSNMDENILVNKNDIVYASTFNQLRDFANNFKLNEGQCDSCNISCNNSHSCCETEEPARGEN